MLRFLGLFLLVIAHPWVAQHIGALSMSETAFRVAEVKPHFECRSVAGRERVREYIRSLQADTDIIVLLQAEFAVDLPSGFTAIGASCGKAHIDSAVAFLRGSEFEVLRPIAGTSVGNYSEMPYVADGRIDRPGEMCTSDPAHGGTRAYAGAVVHHRRSGERFCLVAGTLPHPRLQTARWGYPAPHWRRQFVAGVAARCAGLPVLVVADTNLVEFGSALEGYAAGQGAVWASSCSDPGRWAGPTCCHDISWGHPDPQFWSDRTVLCGGGRVRSFQVEPAFVCGSNQEHRFTRAVVDLRGVGQDRGRGRDPRAVVCIGALFCASLALLRCFRRPRHRLWAPLLET